MISHDSKLLTLARKLIPEGFRPIGYLTELTRQRCDLRVQSGPFQGMRYIERATGSAYIPKLLGIYERELHLIVEQACGLGFSLIIDIGAAEGYYAVGMALRNGQARIEAFEMDVDGMSALTAMIALNGVSEQITVNGFCDPHSLNTKLENNNSKTLVICDVEGNEKVLLDSDLVPGLNSSWILVELHEWLSPTITSLLKDRFAATHRISHVWQEPRHSGEYPFRTFWTTLLPSSYLDWTVSEWRPEQMSWLWMEPLAF
jgi:hypothetical protein